MTFRAFYFVPDSSFQNGLDLKFVLAEVPFCFGLSSLAVKVHPTTLRAISRRYDIYDYIKWVASVLIKR